MPPGFPCPNPTCSHVFAPETIKGAASLKCPRCGTVFNFRPEPPAAPKARPAPPPAARPTNTPRAKGGPPAPARPVPPPAPVAPPVAPPVAVAPPVLTVAPAAPPAPPDPALAFAPEQDLTIRTPALLRRRRARPLRLVAALLLTAALTGGAATGVYFLIQHLGIGATKGGGAGPAQEFKEHNFSLRPPPAPWKQDKGLEQEFRCLLGFSRADPPNHAVIEVKDYGQRAPGKADLLDEALDRLRGYFGEGVAWQPAPPATLDRFEPRGSLAGRPAFVIQFEGSHGNVYHEGECHVAEHQGFGFWVITFAPQQRGEGREAVREEWAALRDGIGLLNERAGWTDRGRPLRPFKGEGYRLAYAPEVWKEQSEPASFDPLAVLVLEGRDPRAEDEGSRAGKAAFLQVVVLPKKEDDKDAAGAARRHFLQRQAAVLRLRVEDLELNPIPDRQGGKQSGPAEIGKASGHLSKNRFQVAGGTLERFVMIAAVPLGEQVVAVYGECDWKRRDFWEQEINGVLEQFGADDK